MAVSSTNRKAGPFLGNDVTVTFPFAFKVFADTDLYVSTIQAGADAENPLTLNSDYTAVLNGDQDTNPGGSITLTAGPLATGFRLVITSGILELQEVTLTNFGGFYPDVLNGEFDKLTILIQQLQEQVNRSIKFPITDNSEVVDLPPAEQRAGKFFYFGSDGSVSLLSGVPASTASASFFSGELIGTKNSINKIFTITNDGAPLGKTPIQAIVWKNFPLIYGVPYGYIWGPSPGQVTFDVAPDPNDTLSAQGIFST